MIKILPMRARGDASPSSDMWRRALAVVVTVGCVLFCNLAVAGCLDDKRRVGVNLSGAEFAAEKLPGTVFKDYVYPDPADMRHFQSLGMNTFRLPFLWERIQPQLFGALDPGELQRIKDTVATAQSLGVCIILDVHNFGQYRGNPIGSSGVPRAAFIDLWARLLTTFKDPANTAFDLMNEPAKMSVAAWASTAQETLNVLRKRGSKHLIMIPGGGWSGAHSWDTKDIGVSNADAFRSFRDPENNYMIEMHQYADADSSGTSNTCVDPVRLSAVMANVTVWANSTKQKLFLGEFGVAVNGPCLKALMAIMEGMKGSSAWGGWTYWSAGKWLGSYPFSIEPDDNGDKPQMAILKNYMP
ncbi:cellulase family protein [Collimonas arenae]|uniref:Cellulase family protein n=1 Tax=Collimonas arenae TaxID=279058 RepID=A0A127PSR8_9BURK|nr:glycoside hydrolase family 5 protein [Collimonas arenae]AMP00796.1 cellulase family protein [Collimonas arenae]AMP10689.1 cellulase family protein [Collimonas arenae]